MTTPAPYLRNLLLRRFNWIEQLGLEKAHEHGYGQVTPAMSRMFANMGGRPVGLSELSRRMGISRQAVHKLARDAAAIGLIEFVAAPEDGRVVQVRFTKAGWAMSAQASRDFEDIEARLRQHIGARNLAEIKRLLEMPWDRQEAADRAQKMKDKTRAASNQLKSGVDDRRKQPWG